MCFESDDDCEKIDKVFGLIESGDYTAAVANFDDYGIYVLSKNHPSDWSIELYNRKNDVIDASAISSSLTDENNVIEQLSRMCKLMYASISHDEDGPDIIVGYNQGERTKPGIVLSLMEKHYALDDLGFAGEKIESRNKAKSDPTHALRVAIKNNYKAKHVIDSLEKGADPNGKIDENFSFLDYAIDNRNTGAAIALLDYGADPHDKGYMSSPLAHAVYMERPKIAEALLKRGVDPNKKAHGELPLHVAIISNKPNVVKLLIKYGARLDSKHEGRSVLGNVLRYFNHCNDREIDNKIKIIDILMKDEEIRDSLKKNNGRYVSLINKNAGTKSSAVSKLIDYLRSLKDT